MTKIFASLAATAVIGAFSLYNTSDAHMMDRDDYRDNRPMRAYSEDYDYSRDSRKNKGSHCHDNNYKSYERMDEAQRRKAIERKERHRRHHEEMMMDYYENNKDKVDLHCHDLD